MYICTCILSVIYKPYIKIFNVPHFINKAKVFLDVVNRISGLSFLFIVTIIILVRTLWDVSSSSISFLFIIIISILFTALISEDEVRISFLFSSHSKLNIIWDLFMCFESLGLIREVFMDNGTFL